MALTPLSPPLPPPARLFCSLQINFFFLALGKFAFPVVLLFLMVKMG
jgi:hypothetical protein